MLGSLILLYSGIWSPQDSILNPVIFNLDVTDLQSELQCDCYEYADDATFYIHSKPCDLSFSTNHINKALLTTWEPLSLTTAWGVA